MSADVMAVLIESCLRASVVLAAAWALTAALRRTAASTRHFVWSSAIAGSILATAISSFGPHVTVEVPVPLAPSPAVVSRPDLAPPDAAPSLPSSAGVSRSADENASTSARAAWPDATLLAAFLWGAGTLGVLAYLIAGALGSWWIRRAARPLHAPWVEEAHVLAEAFEIAPSVAIVESATVTMPMVCGIWRPVVVMPPAAEHWSDDRRRVVVLHELAHIKRRDCLTQVLAQIVCAAYWFNPIVWFAARQLRVERERACDDFVLAAGRKAPTTRRICSRSLRRCDTAACRRLRDSPWRARHSSKDVCWRFSTPQSVGRRLSIRVWRRWESFCSSRYPSQLSSSRLRYQRRTRSRRRQSLTCRRRRLRGPRRLQRRQGWRRHQPPQQHQRHLRRPRRHRRRNRAIRNASEILGDAGAAQIDAQLGAALGVELGREIAAALSAQGNAPADPKTIEALIGALSDSDPDVREMVVVTLGRMRDPRIAAALLPLLKDSDSDVREQAVFALARTGDATAVAAVAAMIDDASPDVREQAVHFLGRSRNREAIPALVKALKDSSADVREQAAFALGQLRDPNAVDPLLGMLKDSSPDVREQAVFALGQLRNAKAVDGLMSALTDANADVREQAAFALGQLRDPRALPALTAALRDSVADVREQAAFAIGQISGQQ